MKNEIFEKLRELCPEGFVTRGNIKKLTGGFLTSSTLACLDHYHKGIPNRQKIGGKTVYAIEDVINWLKSNTELINFDEERE